MKDENIIGGYVSDWAVSWEQLKNANEIVFHVLVQEPLPKDESTERFSFLGGLNSYSKNVPSPELK